jgi:glycosyltransferase involved in cell wall biosynthesis
VVVCPNGVDARRFVPGQDSALRDELVPAGRLAVGFHGRLRPWHGLELLGAALARLLEDGVGVHVVTVGNGDYAEVLSRSVPETHRTHVGWTPHDAVASYVGCFDALPLCYGESVYFSPLKLAEGMACGAVPVVPWSGDWCRFLEHGVNAMMYAAGDATGLARGLATLAGDPEQRRRLARAARITAGGMSWDSIAERVLAVARARRAARVRP